MATVEFKVRISTIQGDMCSDELEDPVDKAVEQAGRTSGARFRLGSWCRGQPLQRCSLDLLTSFGWIRLTWWQVRDIHGRYHQPLDTLLGLEPRSTSGRGSARRQWPPGLTRRGRLSPGRSAAQDLSRPAARPPQTACLGSNLCCPAQRAGTEYALRHSLSRGRSSQVLAYSARVSMVFSLANV